MTDDANLSDLLTVRAAIKDLVADFLYYDRKEDDTLPMGRIEDLIRAEVLTPEMLAVWFTRELHEGLAAS